MQDAKEEVRSRLNIEDVIGEYVQLKRAGRNFKGLSPFTAEKTASFYVSPEKHIWHDFSSNKGGDIFTFIMEVEGMDFRESLEHLARKAGVDMSMYDTKGSQEIAKRKKRLLQAHDLAAKYYQQSLIHNKHAVEYVFKLRGLSKDIVQTFRIGYAPSSGDALVKFLTKKGFTAKELSQAGLVNRFGGDLFRGRMMVPLMDGTGQVIGFTARIIDDEPNAPKYLNTPQTLLYDKGRHVFGLSQAKEAIRNNDYAVIVEGNLDVVSSHQAGFTQVVATAGTAMTEHHLRALVRLSGHARLAFDGDKAGLAATERAVPIAQGVGIELGIVSMPDGAKDPDELIKQDPKLWQKAIDHPKPAVDWVIEQYSLREDLKTAAGKRKFTTAALDMIRALSDSVEQEHYLAQVAEYSDSSIDALKSKLASGGDNKDEKSFKKIVQPTEVAQDPALYQDNLLAVALIDSATHDLFSQIDITMFSGEERQAVAKYVKTLGAKTIKDTPKDLQNYDTYVKILLLKADARYADWNDHDRYFETARLLRLITTEHKKKQKDLLIEELRDAETLGDDTKAAQIRTALNNLIKEIQSGKS
ncbi:MAG TPA: DNA primase [Candidatus Saccharibacteria bacterium]|nr:DNA primase [Candidatus Saccharibacteria bacterium]HRQ07025.1 DNA primase [Candidatus Saccharibacteria bacterium]